MSSKHFFTTTGRVRGAWNVAGILADLKVSQYWPEEAQAANRRARLRDLLTYACATVPFYHDRFDAIGVTPQSVLTPDVWATIPLLTRRDIQEAGTDLHSCAVPIEHGRPEARFTGGSTGQPVMTLGTPFCDRMWQALTLRDHIWHQRDFSETLASIRYTATGSGDPPLGDRYTNWGLATAGLIETGPSVLLSVRSTLEQQIDWLLRVKPGYLLTYPSIIAGLLERVSELGVNLPGMREIRTFGEIVEPALRTSCETVLGVPLSDVYSTQEVGYIAIQCPVGQHYHVQSESLFVEVLDDAGQSCQPGETGRVVLTTLFNYAMPLIRYEVGDYAEVGEPCRCGRSLSVLRRILGRQRNMFLLPNGQRRWPAFEIDPTKTFRGPLPIRQFQVVQRTLDLVVVRLVSDRSLLESEEQSLRDQVTAWLGHAFSVVFEYVDEIPRTPTGKFEDYRCEVCAA